MPIGDAWTAGYRCQFWRRAPRDGRSRSHGCKRSDPRPQRGKRTVGPPSLSARCPGRDDRGADRTNSYTLARVDRRAATDSANFYESPNLGIRRRAIAADTWAMTEGHSLTQADNGAAQSQNDTGASGPASTLAGVSIGHLSVIQSDGARATAATATADRDSAPRRLIEWTGRQSRTARNRALDGARLALTFRMARNVSPDNRGGELLPVPHPSASPATATVKRNRPRFGRKPLTRIGAGDADNSRATGEGGAIPFPLSSLVRARAV